LTCIYCCFAAAPFYKVLEALGIFKYGANCAEAKALEALFAGLCQIKEYIDTLNIKEMKFGALVAEYCI